MNNDAEKTKAPDESTDWQMPEPVFRTSEGRSIGELGKDSGGTDMSEQDTEIHNKEETLIDELTNEDVVDTSTKRGRFSAFTLFFVVMVIVGLVVAAFMLYSGAKVAPEVQESMNSNSR